MADIYPQDPGLSDSTIERNKAFDYVRNMLGDGMVEVELDPKHYETALDRALTKFRQRSSNAVEESYMFLELIQDVNEYRLPDEVIEVQSIFRRAVGSRSGLGAGGTLFEPFNLAYTNSYLLTGSMMGGLATYEMFAGYQKLVGRMFGAYIEFKWRQTNHILTILQRPFAAGEQVLLRTHNFRPDFMLGEARSKFGNIAGPGGSGIQLNGTALMTAGQQEIEKLEKEINDMVPGGTPLTFVIG